MPSAGLLAILDEMSTHIECAVTAGFVPAAEIGADVAELYSAEADPAVLAVAARRMAGEALREHLLEQAYWPDVTDCERLDAAFSRLERAGIICRHNYACCGSCGAAEMRDLLDAQRRAGRDVRGYVFYHQQDTERAIEGDGLLLNFGAAAGGAAAALAIGREVVAVLSEHGLCVEWNGEWSRRIGVELDWKRRRVE
jgi:hypothetical protein